MSAIVSNLSAVLSGWLRLSSLCTICSHKLQRACQQPQIEVQQAQQALNRGRKRLQKTIKAQDALRTHLEIMNGSAENLLAERVGDILSCILCSAGNYEG